MFLRSRTSPIFALQIKILLSTLTPLVDEIIFQVLEIIPHEGTVPPYSVQHVHVGFHGFERTGIKAIVACKILCGPTEQIQLQARADTIRYSIDTDVIDFKEQVILFRSS